MKELFAYYTSNGGITQAFAASTSHNRRWMTGCLSSSQDRGALVDSDLHMRLPVRVAPGKVTLIGLTYFWSINDVEAFTTDYDPRPVPVVIVVFVKYALATRREWAESDMHTRPPYSGMVRR